MAIRSSIRPELKRQVLMRGSMIGGCGALLLLATGVFLPLSLLKIWGWAIFLIGIGLITLGLLPYRKLTRLESKPQTIEMKEDRFSLTSNQKPLFTVPFSAIEKMAYINTSSDYGIAIWLHNPLTDKIVVHSEKFDIEKYRELSQRKFGCDLMLPYFSQRGFDELQELWQFAEAKE